MKPIQGQMTLDLFPERHTRKSAPERCMGRLIEAGCDESRVKPIVEVIFKKFTGYEAEARANCLAHFFGDRAIPRLQACPPSLIGVDDERIDHNTVYDRCWAARWIPLAEALEVKMWHYNYRTPYTGAPIYIWYIDNQGREIRRPYED